jgi:hypothetical protein
MVISLGIPNSTFLIPNFSVAALQLALDGVEHGPRQLL